MMTPFPQNVLDCVSGDRLSQALDCIEAQLAVQPDDARAHYFATVLFNITGRRQQALARLPKIGLSPGSDSNFERLSLTDFERWQQGTADFAVSQRAALALAWPATPICSLPRSGSGWFVGMFARLFDLPIGRMCFGRFPDLQAVRATTPSFSAGTFSALCASTVVTVQDSSLTSNAAFVSASTNAASRAVRVMARSSASSRPKWLAAKSYSRPIEVAK